MVTKFKRNLRKLKYYRENVSESSIIKKYIKEAKPQLKLIVKNAKKKEVRYISELSIKNRKDAFNPVLGFVYDLKRLFQDKNY